MAWTLEMPRCRSWQKCKTVMYLHRVSVFQGPLYVPEVKSGPRASGLSFSTHEFWFCVCAGLCDHEAFCPSVTAAERPSATNGQSLASAASRCSAQTSWACCPGNQLPQVVGSWPSLGAKQACRTGKDKQADDIPVPSHPWALSKLQDYSFVPSDTPERFPGPALDRAS